MSLCPGNAARDVTPHQATKIFYDDEEQSIRKTADNNSSTEGKGKDAKDRRRGVGVRQRSRRSLSQRRQPITIKTTSHFVPFREIIGVYSENRM